MAGYKKDPVRKGGHWLSLRASRPHFSPLINSLFLPDCPAHCLFLCTRLTYFYIADGPGPSHWPLFWGGRVARIQLSHCHGLTSISDWELKPCFKMPQVEVTCDLIWCPNWEFKVNPAYSTCSFRPLTSTLAPFPLLPALLSIQVQPRRPCPTLGPLPTCLHTLSPRWIPVQRPMEAGRASHHLLWGGAPPPFRPSRSPSAHLQCLPCPKDGNYVTS